MQAHRLQRRYKSAAAPGESMDVQTVTCPECGKVYRLPEQLPAKPRIKLRCPSCRIGFTIASPRAGQDLRADRSRQPFQAPQTRQEPAHPAAREESPPSGEARVRLERRARRLARAIVQELLGGQKERRDRALAKGSLLLEFREDVRQAWIAYQEKAGAEVAQNTPFFQDALNEILADGNPIF